MQADTVDAAAVEAGQKCEARLVLLAHRARRHLGRQTVAVGTDLGNAVEAGVPVRSHVRGHGSDSPGTVRVDGSEPIAVDSLRDLTSKHSHGHDEVAVAVDTRDLVATCWVEHDGRLEANAQLVRAVGGARLEMVAEKR